LAFVTGTRADYGKLKSIMLLCESQSDMEIFVYVTGMHLMPEYGSTVNEIKSDGYKNIYVPPGFKPTVNMDENLAQTILYFSAFVREIKPDIIVVHGDRIEPLAGAIVGVLNNVKVAHIEGGEVTGTADEFMRHAISKLSVMHFVANNEAKYRIIQLGEHENSIYVIGSPDIDIMLSKTLPAIEVVKNNHQINFDTYSIFIYHPVTTSINLEHEISQVISAVTSSAKNYIVIYPNNDSGSQIICNAIETLENNNHFMLFKSLPFEDFLILLKNAEFIIGNSSAGIREACVYGVPAIDIGTRQNSRYVPGALKNIQHTEENAEYILQCIKQVSMFRFSSNYFGDGESAKHFLEAIRNFTAIKTDLQKTFVDMDVTSQAIMNYINEVCF
jgi:UDP-N-acetylglucosamine 2-epimerase (hydrolysing)